MRVRVGDLDRGPPGRGRVGSRIRPVSQQRTDRFAQVDRADRSARASRTARRRAAEQLEYRVAVLQQQRGRTVGPHLVHQRARRRGTGAGEGRGSATCGHAAEPVRRRTGPAGGGAGLFPAVTSGQDEPNLYRTPGAVQPHPCPAGRRPPVSVGIRDNGWSGFVADPRCSPGSSTTPACCDRRRSGPGWTSSWGATWRPATGGWASWSGSWSARSPGSRCWCPSWPESVPRSPWTSRWWWTRVSVKCPRRCPLCSRGPAC